MTWKSLMPGYLRGRRRDGPTSERGSVLEAQTKSVARRALWLMILFNIFWYMVLLAMLWGAVKLLLHFGIGVYWVGGH